MQCNQIVKRRVEPIAVSDSIFAAARRMGEANVAFLPVCSADGSVVGTLTDRDLGVRVMNGDPSTVPADVKTAAGRALAIRELAWESWRQLRRGIAGLVAFPAAAALAFGALCMSLSLLAEPSATVGPSASGRERTLSGDEVVKAFFAK